MFASTYLASTYLRDKRIRAAAVGFMAALIVVVGSVAYDVKKGDTLSEIAAEHGVSLADLIAANDIANPDLIRIGQSIIIPGEGGEADVVHVVALGETLGSISVEYKTPSADIARVNHLTNPDLIRVGQKLTIPNAIGAGGGGRAENPGFHVVKAGETLSSIATRYGVSIAQLADANGITNTSMLYIGTRLALSGSSFVADAGGGSATHTVARGDTLGSIAKAYGVSVSDIAAVNGIDDINSIRVGQKLNIPGAGAWMCPVGSAKYVNDWGFPRSDERFHEGTDLFAPRGTEVVAPVDGEIELLTGVVGGLQFRLHGDDGVLYIGSHLDAYGRSGRVRAGEVIGRVGDTGNARGGPTHLHFEIHPDGGKAANPYPTLQEAGC